MTMKSISFIFMGNFSKTAYRRHKYIRCQNLFGEGGRKRHRHGWILTGNNLYLTIQKNSQKL